MWVELLEVARWAPSPHNIQPWRLRVASATEAELVCPADRRLPATDPAGRFTLVGLAVFAETLRVAARARGRELDVEWNGLGARLRLREGGGEDFDPRLVLERRTARGPYDGLPAPEPVLDRLRAIAAEHGQELHATSDPALLAWVVELNRETLFYDLAADAARTEIGQWLRFSEREAAARADGFSPSALGFPGWLLRLFFRRHGLAETPLLRPLLRAAYGRTMRGTATVAWLTGPFETEADWVRSGELLARLWLALTEAGLSLHPFGSVITNERANARLRERIHDDRGPWLLMRVGRPTKEPPRSHRLPARELIL